jgi:hypothetical protein
VRARGPEIARCVDWEVEYYEREDGVQPVEVFENAISPKLWGKLARSVEAVAREQWSLGGGIFEACHGYADIFEVRARRGDDLGRVYCAVDNGPPARLILLNGIVKRNNTPTPPAAFVEAQANLADYRVNNRVSPEEQEGENDQNEQV